MPARELTVTVVAGDLEEAALATRNLRRELLDADVLAAESPMVGTAPPGAKGDAVNWAQLVVEFATALPALIGLIRSWSRRNEGMRLTVTLGGDRLELSSASEAEQSAIVSAWLARHTDEATSGATAQRPPDRDEPVHRS
jgi:hypothetical protein